MKRSKFNLSHYRLQTGDMGQLMPCGLVEALPLDTFQHRSSAFMRLSPMAAPVMHPVTVRIHHFFVPHRLTWPQSENGGWEEFITSGPDGTNSQTVPTISIAAVDNPVGGLPDYLGLPPGQDLVVSALPFRAFNLVFNEWYRDEDLVTERALTDLTVPKVAWSKDYFTSARPWPQKGPAVTIPLGTRADVRTDAPFNSNIGIMNAGGLEVEMDSAVSTVRLGNQAVTAGHGMYADLANSTGVDVTTFREAFALQRYAEARARYGSRYIEYLRYLGVRSNLDGRLQRPEFLGGGRTRINISEVLQTANEAAQTRYGVGDLYGHGVAAVRGNAYRRTFPEHGYVLSFLSVRPASIYMNGAERTWLKRTREEFWQRELQHVGQQQVWQGEVYADGSADDYVTFGYQDRYSEYRQQPSGVAGEFRTTLNYWHLARDFTQAPALNASFVDCDPSKRIFNVQTEDTLWIAMQHSLVARRLVSGSATPRIV